jgi:hypothetical protein
MLEPFIAVILQATAAAVRAYDNLQRKRCMLEQPVYFPAVHNLPPWLVKGHMERTPKPSNAATNALHMLWLGFFPAAC